ncbi:MAG: efflux RND transporter periplasmic adaptor subunit [Cellvibrionaceae bacterium]|nr:efflux RND transporter periplasmic adaptor subunit [Cellvibrionaceae bacterium]
MKNSKQILYPILVLLLAAGVVAGLLATKSPPDKKKPETKIPYVSTEIIQLEPMTLSVNSQGVVNAKFSTNLLAQVAGEIIQVSESFVRGGVVRKGELLAQIDPLNYEVQLEQANATLASARAQFILERAQGQVAEAEWGQITTAKPSELGLRKPQQEQALAAVKAAEASVKQANKDLQRTRIIAPFNALVTQRQVSPGTFVNMGTAIGEVMDVAVAEVRLPVPASEMAFLHRHGIGATAALRASVAGKPQQWQAKIVRDEGLVDERSRMVFLVAEVHDPYLFFEQQDLPASKSQDSKRLPFGTYVNAEIEGISLPAAASVPRHLLKEGKVALAVDQKLHFSEVEVIRHQGKNSIVVGGLTNGDQLITSTMSYLVEGMALKTDTQVNNAKPAKPDSADVSLAKSVDEGNPG